MTPPRIMVGNLRVKVKVVHAKGGASDLLAVPARQAVATMLHSRAAVRRVLAAAGLDGQWPEDSDAPVFVIVYQAQPAPSEL